MKSYWYETQKTGSSQQAFSFLAEGERDDLPLNNALRDDVRRWRDARYEGATPVTKQLLAHFCPGGTTDLPDPGGNYPLTFPLIDKVYTDIL